MIDAVSTLSSVKATLRPVAQSQTSYSGSSSLGSRNAFLVSRIRMDNLQNVAIIEVRARDTGEVVNQYPTEEQIRAIKRAAELEERNIQESSREMAQQYSNNTATDASGSSEASATVAAASVYAGSAQSVQSADVSADVAVASSGGDTAPATGDYTQSVVV